jgi:hypothetical protein
MLQQLAREWRIVHRENTYPAACALHGCRRHCCHLLIFEAHNPEIAVYYVRASTEGVTSMIAHYGQLHDLKVK